MIQVVCAIRDEVAAEFMSPVYEMSEERAIRMFENLVMVHREKKEGLMFSHVDDFSFYKIGTYDTEKGYLSSETPVLLRKGSEV